MIRDGQASHAKIKRATQEALIEWFAQSERLNIARTHYQLRGDRFRDFVGIDRSSAFPASEAAPASCRDPVALP